MPRSHRPRKRYTPRPVRLDAHEHARDRIATLLDHQRAALLTPVQTALADFRRGAGSVRAWCDLADGVNVAEQLARDHIGGAPLLPVFDAAQGALVAVHERHVAGRGWTLRGPEITALDEAVHWAGWQLEQCSQGELHDAIATVVRRSAGALAGGVAPDTQIVGLLGRTTHAPERTA